MKVYPHGILKIRPVEPIADPTALDDAAQPIVLSQLKKYVTFKDEVGGVGLVEVAMYECEQIKRSTAEYYETKQDAKEGEKYRTQKRNKNDWRR